MIAVATAGVYGVRQRYIRRSVQYPEEIEYVLINGQTTVDGSKLCPTAAGKVLRKNGLA